MVKLRETVKTAAKKEKHDFYFVCSEERKSDRIHGSKRGTLKSVLGRRQVPIQTLFSLEKCSQ